MFNAQFRLLATIVFGLAIFNQDCFAIINGRPVGPDEFPSHSAVMVLNLSGPNPGMCSGTLIGADLVVTAMHCLINDQTIRLDRTPPSKLQVYFGGSTGSFDSLDKSRFGEVVDFRKSDNNANTLEELASNDLLLLKLKNPAIQGFNGAPLLRDPKRLFEGMAVDIAGFGITKIPGPADPPSHIHLLNSFSSGIQQFDGNWIYLKPTEGGEGGGDSGGPLYGLIDNQQYLIGVASGFTVENNQVLAKYTSIPKMIDWLLGAAKSMGSPID